MIQTDIQAALDADGFARLPGLLHGADCDGLIARYDDDGAFRKIIDMARYRYGQGQYRYFAYPLPDVVRALRETLYPPLAAIANRFAERLREDRRFPATHAAFLDQCHAAGQVRPTPLLLRYGPGDYNCLHRDLYGDIHFPLQVVVGLSKPEDYEGGEFLLVENRARQQSRGHALRLDRGEGLVFPVMNRPVTSKRGFSRAGMRHGVSTVTAGERVTLGIIFHDAA
ncbi:MAG: 2OG-Fe(II) oxygenase [Alphaproteobacteria bacterium]